MISDGPDTIKEYPLYAPYFDGSLVPGTGRGISSVTTTTLDWCGDVVLDHLGSVRAVVDGSGTSLETDDYYPLGGPLPTGSSTTLQPEKYQGKDWNPTASFNVYDFGARLYDPALGRWLSQDPLAEKYYAHSPYLFCAGSPINFVDPRGMIWYSINSEGHITVIDSEKDGPDRLYSNYDSLGDNVHNYIQVSSNSFLKNLVYNPEAEKGKVYFSKSTDANDVFSVFKFAADHSNKEWVVHRNGVLYTIGTKLDDDSASSYQDYGIPKPDASIHSHPNTPISDETYSMGYGAAQYHTDLKKVEWGQSAKYNYVYFPESHNVFSVNPSHPVFIRKATSVKSFYWGTLNTK